MAAGKNTKVWVWASALSVISFIVGCSKPPDAIGYWRHAKLGMNREQIKQLQGEPNGLISAPKIEHESDNFDAPVNVAIAGGLAGMFFGTLDETWEYAPPDYMSHTLTKAELAEREAKIQQMSEEELAELGRKVCEAIFSGISDEAFVVHFDQEGYVTKLRAPLKGPYADYPTTPPDEPNPAK